MRRLNVNDTRRAAELNRFLETWSEDQAPVLRSFLPSLRELIGAERTTAYAVTRSGNRFTTSALEASGLDPLRTRHAFDGWLKGQTGPWTGFTPDRPEPVQRNVALRFEQITRITGKKSVPITNEFLPRLGMGGWDQLRALICDGPSLLFWVGGFRPEKFTERERVLLSRLIPALQARLKLERQLGDAAVTAAALPAAMEAISSAAYIIGASGDVKHANSMGAQLLDQQRETSQWLANDVKTSTDNKFALTKLVVHGAPDYFLAVLDRPSRDPGPYLKAAVERWQLTTKQSEVLGWLVRGAANKTIAVARACAEGTIELHVTAMMAKAQVETRAQLVAKFWAEL